MDYPPNPGNWSNLPLDIVRSVLKRLSFVDFQRAKRVCSNWYLGSKQTFPQKRGSPWLSLFPEDGGCMLYNPDEDKVYTTKRDFSGTRFLANSGNWFLVLDSGSNLHIIDLFSEKTVPLPSLESIRSSTSTIKRVGETEFDRKDSDGIFKELRSDDVRGVLWVDEITKEYVVVWLFDNPGHAYLSYCKKGDTHYTDIPLFHDRASHKFDGLSYMVLKGYHLYISTSRRYVRVLDLSGRQGCEGQPFGMLSGHQSRDSSIAVTRTGEVLLVESDPWDRNCFRVYKKDPNLKHPDASTTVLKVDSLGGDDEALLLDLGYTVPANGIEPDSIYFTRHYRPCQCTPRDLDICVYNLATKTLKRLPALDAMNLIDARWFLPGN